MALEEIEDRVKQCYSTWSESYYRDYYGDNAGYPPVHRDLVRGVLQGAGAANVLDAGCGPASMLRDLAGPDLDVYGFDLTPEMVLEAKKILGGMGVPDSHIWDGSVADPAAFKAPEGPEAFDAAICMGVLPHIPVELDEVVIRNLAGAVKPGGTVVLEARNQLFALFTLNRYSHQFFVEELIGLEGMKERAGGEVYALDEAARELEERFRMDLPPIRKGKSGEPGYDEVLSRTHNPLVLKQQFEAAGLKEVRVLFYHYHALPPMLQKAVPELFARESVAMEKAEDWRGYFMASAFMVVGKRA